jgi:hypothetical protein
MGLAKLLSVVRSRATTFRANRHDGRSTINSFSRQNISSESEDFLLQSYPQCLRRFCRHPVVVGILFVCFATLNASITTSIFGGFTAGAKVNLTQDWGFIPVTLFGFAAFYYYFRMPTYFSAMLTKLRDNGIFASDDIEVGERVSRLAQDSRIRAVPIFFAVVVTIFIAALTVLRTTDTGYWWEINRINSASVVVNFMLIWLSLSGVVISMAISGVTLNSILVKNEIRVHSLHPDKSGGFSPVGDFSFQLSVMLLLPGIMVGGFVWASIEADNFRYEYPVLLLEGLAYLVIVPILFYLPVRGVHKAMVAYRDKLIKQTYARYSVENLSKYDPQNEETLTNVKGAVEQMDVLKRLAVHESSYPVWPFGFRTRVGVFVNSILPLTLTFIGIVVQIF